MVQQYPELVHAVNSQGDETAIGAAAHMGNQEIVQCLLDAGAPLDITTAAMMRWRAKVADFWAKDPTQANAKGAHTYALLYFVAQSGYPQGDTPTIMDRIYLDNYTNAKHVTAI